MTRCRATGELGGVKALSRTALMTSLVLGSALVFFSGVRSTNLSLQAWPEQSRRAAPRYRPIAFGPVGSPVDRCYA